MKLLHLFKKHVCITVFTSVIISSGNAQSIKNIGSAATGSFNTYNEYGPFRTVPAALTTTPISNRHVYLFPKAALTGIEKDAKIDSLSFYKKYFGELLHTANLKLYLKNTTNENLGTGSLDWNASVNGATKVFDKNPTTEISGNEGAKIFKFSESFNYEGNNLIVFIEYFQQGPTHDYASWYYDNTTVSYANNTVKYAENATTSPPASLTKSSNIHPVTQLFYTPPPTLPLVQVDFWAKQNSASNEIVFKTSGEHDILNITLEKSTDGINYKFTETVLPKNEVQINTYRFIDNEILKAKTWYRIKITGKDGSVTYSKTLLLQDDLLKTKAINVFPNPAKNDLQISINKIVSDRISIKIINSAGVQVWQKNIDSLKGNYNTTINIENFAGGNYFIILSDDETTNKVSFIKI